MTVFIRQARHTDRTAVEALVAREAAAGRVLPRDFASEAFLVAESGGRVAGTLSLTRWSDDVLELGTVISDLPGHGVGQRLIHAALDRAARSGHRWAVVLTGIPGFFQRQGFTPIAATPWARARGPVGTAGIEAGLDVAIGHKAAASCIRCPALGTCSQALLALPLADLVRACA